jgi:hypothetical protein
MFHAIHKRFHDAYGPEVKKDGRRERALVEDDEASEYEDDDGYELSDDDGG